MPYNISIKVGEIEVNGVLNDSLTAKLIWENLPIESSGNLWGGEIYFSIPVNSELDETARDVVKLGDLGYWPTGRAFCIFFGPTPLSEDDEIVPASDVNIVGQLTDDLNKLKGFKDGDFVTISRAGGTKNDIA
jgi:hypothetical protein